MGWRTTMYITREDALKEVLGLILKANDDQLSDILFNLSPDPLYNYYIVDKYDPKDCLDYIGNNYCDVGHI